ncbi:MAG: hypothetical protein M0Z65_09225 [Firmicutes bacterium]|nr:hypothetical protein [Bacillota bacterium]
MRIIGGSYWEWKHLSWEEQLERFNRAKADYLWRHSTQAQTSEDLLYSSKLIDLSGLNHCYPMQESVLH